MSASANQKPLNQAARFKIMYVGPDARNIERALSVARQPVGLNAVTGVARALKVAKVHEIDCAVVDQRADTEEGALLVATLAGLSSVKRIVVITEPESAFGYQVLGRKIQVICDPGDHAKLRRAVFNQSPGEREPGSGSAGWHQKVKSGLTGVFKTLRELIGAGNFARFVIPVLSFIYKKVALIKLGALFAVFVSYGILITFFLVSSDWAAPLTLSKGHELVVGAERQLNELKVKRNLVGQRLAKERDETARARVALADAKVLVGLVANIIDGEIEQRLVLKKDLNQQVRHLSGLRGQIRQALGKSGYENQLRRKFKNRLINRKTFDSRLLGILELRQRAAGVDTKLARYRREAHATELTVRMLESMRHQLQLPRIRKISGTSVELAPLANQIVEVKTAVSAARRSLATHLERLKLLEKNKKILDAGIDQLMTTPLVRAAASPVVVLFVPYSNEANFKKGEPLFSCAVSIFWCRKVGVVSDRVPGEVTAVHPFFGKNMRGVFIEAILDDKDAAHQEVLHVGRPPLFF